MKFRMRAMSAILSLAMLVGLLYPAVEAAAEETALEGVESVNLGDLLQVSADGGEKNLMSLYEGGLYEGKVQLSKGDHTYQIFVNGKKTKEGSVHADTDRDFWVRYETLEDKAVTQDDDEFLYPATWVGGFSNVKKDVTGSDATKYLAFGDWAPSDENANLDYMGGGIFQKKFTFDAMEQEQKMDYKIAFGGDWDHGCVPAGNKSLTFPQGSTEITIWANARTKETFDSITDRENVTTEKMELSIGDNNYPMVQTGFHTFLGTVQLEAGAYSWKHQKDGADSSFHGSFELPNAAAVTFFYDSEKNVMLNSAENAKDLAAVINYPMSYDSGDGGTEPEVGLEGVGFGDLLQISINGGDKCLMSPYCNGMYEGEVQLSAGTNVYRIFRDGKLAKIGEIKVSASGKTWVRYFSFQDKVITPYEGSDGFKFPATWVGSFSNLTKADGSKYLNFADWAPDDGAANLDYAGGGVFQKKFVFDTMESGKSMEYKIAFGGDWSHGSVPGADKSLTFPEGGNEIFLWANTQTNETFDSVNDTDATVGGVQLSVGSESYDMIQIGKNTFLKTVLLEAGQSYACQISGQQSRTFTPEKTTAVTFWYDAKSREALNSLEHAEELKDRNNWVNPLNVQYDAYGGDDLGAVYSPESTTFKVWAPTASSVALRRYTKGNSSETGDALIEESNMEKDAGADGTWSNGVWKITVSGDLKNTYYTYAVTVGGTTRETNDIYAKAVGLNGERGMVVDLEATNPAGWEEDAHVMAEKPTDAMVWEVNVRDFSSADSSGMEHKGKFLAFTEQGTTVNGNGSQKTGIDYLKELGINYVQLLPAFDYVNDETDSSNAGYNWGYSPLNYNVPEGLYATDPSDGNVRINEFKQMVQALHENGIGVIMDVVFNHVGGDGKESYFNRTVPGYYFRQDEWGNFLDSGTACGNETASEAEMFRKYMIDSVVYWASEYHIDGFRFDLMGCHDVETMNQLRAELDKLPNGEKILTYGEPWAAGTTNQPEGVKMVSQDTMADLNVRVGAFNDYIRDSLKGRVFDDSSTGFIQAGNGTQQPETCPVYQDEDTMAALQGNTNTAYPSCWALQPSQVVSYVSAHDNLGLYDKLQYSVNKITEVGDERYYQRDENLVKMNKMAAAAVATSQGTMFLQAGEEIARSKGGVENSYESPLYFEESGRELNQINWARTEEFSDLLEYYKGLLKLRKSYAPFRTSNMETVQNMAFSEDDTSNLVAYTISSPGEKWDMVAVLMNSNPTSQQVTLKAKEGAELPTVWNCVVNQDKAGVETLETYQGTVITVPAQTVLVLAAANKDMPEQPKDPDTPEQPKDPNTPEQPAIVNAAMPVVTVSQSAKTAEYGEKITLTAAASITDSGTLSYQWYKNTKSSKTGATAISGATAKSYTAPATAIGDVYYYVAVANTNSAVTGTKTAVKESDLLKVTVTKAANPLEKTASTIKKAIGSKAFTLKTGAVGKTTFKSSKPKVAKISKSGKVTMKKPGKTVITVRANGNEYYKGATKKITLKVTPKKVSVKSVKSTEAKTITVKWKKDKNKVTGYQIQYALKKNFKGAKTKTIAKRSTVSYTLKNLKGGKKYYIRMRAYKKDGGKITGAWSKVKAIKVKN